MVGMPRQPVLQLIQLPYKIVTCNQIQGIHIFYLIVNSDPECSYIYEA